MNEIKLHHTDKYFFENLRNAAHLAKRNSVNLHLKTHENLTVESIDVVKYSGGSRLLHYRYHVGRSQYKETIKVEDVEEVSFIPDRLPV